MGENLTPLIGDFGSVKALPQASSDVPGSGHSPLYQPPESIQSGRYSVAGDLYQAGMLLYQLVGGYLPYDEISWLNKNQKRKYESMSDNIDRCVFATECLRKRISAGRVLVIGSIPPWISGPLKSVIRKAAHKDPSKRFQSASEFAAKLIAAMSKSPDWTFVCGCPTLQSAKGGTEFRVVDTGTVSDYSVEKRRNAGWRRDNKLGNGVLADMICAVEAASGW